MLIGRPCDGGFFVVDGFSRIVRLGEALAETGALQETAMARTIEALKICAEKIKSRNVRHVRAVATAACRHADNGDAFVKRVLAETGLELTTISADDEAQLTLSGCAPLLDTGHPHGLLFDIGGDVGTQLMSAVMSRLQRPVESYGKAAIVGVAGEFEHGGACIHPKLGKRMRSAIGGGKAVISSNVKVAAAGASIDVPLGHKDEPWSFDHFDTLTVCVADAPRPNEIVIVVAVADGGRLSPRCGDGPIT